MMKKLPGIIALIAAAPLLAACVGVSGAGVQAGYSPADHPLPGVVVENLPSGVSAADVVTRDGCYFYRAGDGVLPVTVTVSDGGLLNYCIG